MAEVTTACDGIELGADMLDRMPYNLAVIEEAMRLHPPAYMVGRETARAHVGGHHLPAGAIVAVNIRGIHRRPDYFPEAQAFRPERMLGEATVEPEPMVTLRPGGGMPAFVELR